MLYHFTCRELLPLILRDGLVRGEVPVTATTVVNAVWLTTMDTARGHGLSDGTPMKLPAGNPKMVQDADGKQHFAGYTEAGDTVLTADKTAVRIKVELASEDQRLEPWRKLSRRLMLAALGEGTLERSRDHQAVLAPLRLHGSGSLHKTCL